MAGYNGDKILKNALFRFSRVVNETFNPPANPISSIMAILEQYLTFSKYENFRKFP